MSATRQLIEEMERKAISMAPENKAFLDKLARTKPKNLDRIIHKIHYEVFNEVDCLDCGRCCSSLGPMIFESDIDRMSSAVKMKTSAFKDMYIRMDEDGDYVFKEMPCPFLGHDNYCFIYQNRPKACREYPHTDRKRFYQVALKTYYNITTCPAVFEIVNRLKREMV